MYVCSSANGQHPIYTAFTWYNHIGFWRNASGKFTDHPRKWDGRTPRNVPEAQALPGQLALGDDSSWELTLEDKEPAKGTEHKDEPTLAVSVVRKQGRLTTAEMAATIHDFLAPFGDNVPTNSYNGWEMSSKVRTSLFQVLADGQFPVYSNYVWENAISAWRNASGKFAQHPRKWDGRSAVEVQQAGDLVSPVAPLELGQPAAETPVSETPPNPVGQSQMPVEAITADIDESVSLLGEAAPMDHDEIAPAPSQAVMEEQIAGAPGAPEAPPTPIGGTARMSIEDVAAAIHAYVSPLGDMAPRNRDIACYLELKVSHTLTTTAPS